MRITVLTVIGILAVALVASAQSTPGNLRPVIGVLSQPTAGSYSPSLGSQYIAASYIKYIEGAGALAAPILYDISNNELEALFNQLDAVIFPGGGVDSSDTEYWASATSLFSLALTANANGHFFPVWGTCFGFQTLTMLISSNMSLLSSTDSENLTLPLTFTSAASGSRLFGSLPSKIMDIFSTEAVTMNNHMWSVTPAAWAENAALGEFFDVLSTNVDRNGIEFISTIEAKTAPVYASQWHPEKPMYEWVDEVINHSADSVLANQQMANFLVSQVKSYSTRPISTNTSILIYNYPVTYTAEISSSFEQIYFFP